MVGVPFKGGCPAATALLAGQVDLMFEQTGAAIASIQAGKIRPIAVTSAKRLSTMPDVPTFAEAGYPQVLGEFAAFIDSETDKWSKLVKERDIRIE